MKRVDFRRKLEYVRNRDSITSGPPSHAMAGLAQATAAPESPARVRKTTRALACRVNTAGWKAVKLLALDQNRSLDSMMIEAMNDVLRKYGREPVVEKGAPPLRM